jgi:hypothetical protein
VRYCGSDPEIITKLREAGAQEGIDNHG